MPGNQVGAEFRALIVAADRYDDSRLANLRAPAQDARQLAEVLADPSVGGYRVTTLLNQPSHVVSEEIEGFFAEGRLDDLLLLYMSCHGFKDAAGHLYFCLSTTKLDRLAATGVPAYFVHERVERCRSRRVLLLDCCYSGAYLRGHVPRAGEQAGLEALDGRGWAVITSSTAVEYSFEIDSDAMTATPQPSVFTAAVVEGLRTGDADHNRDGLVSVDDLYAYVYDSVSQRTPHQKPRRMGDVRGDLVIAKSPRHLTAARPPRDAATDNATRAAVEPSQSPRAAGGEILAPDVRSDVVIVYADRDRTVAERIHNELIREGYSVSSETIDNASGSEDFARILDLAKRSRYLITVLSASSAELPFIIDGLSAKAIADIELGKTIVIPLLYESCPPPPGLGLKHYADFSEEFDSGFHVLADALRAYAAVRKGSTRPYVETLPGQTLNKAAESLQRVLRNDTKLYMVMDLGGTKAYISLMTGEADRLVNRKFTTESHSDQVGLGEFVSRSFDDAIGGISKETNVPVEDVQNRIEAYSVAFAGPTDSASGIVRDASNFEVKDFPLVQHLTEHFGKPVYLENDANLGVLGEAWQGAAKGFRNVIGIVIGTGIGGGILIDGSLYRGAGNAAGEIGHIVMDVSDVTGDTDSDDNADSDIICGCGQRGCFEALASRRAIARKLLRRKRAQDPDDIRWHENNLGSDQLADYVRSGDADAVEIVGEATRIWGKAVFSLLNILNPDIIFFGGGFVRQLGDILLEPVRDEAEKCMNSVYEIDGRKIPIVVGELENPMLYGACHLAMNQGIIGGDVTSSFARVASSGLDDHDWQVLQSLRKHGRALINPNPNSDFHEDKLRKLRNKGLIETLVTRDQGQVEMGLSLRRSKYVEITQMGRILIEMMVPARERAPLKRLED
jgi:predicted NBD/HSP70 family sugar kinase/uncharacterized caspase-like protein